MWRRTVGSGISPTGLYALIWGAIWFIHWADFMYYRPLTERALIYSAIPLIAIYVSECLVLAASGTVVAQSWEFRRDALRRWTLACGLIALLAGLIVFAASWLTFGNVFSHARELKTARTSQGLAMYGGTPLGLPAKYCSLLLGASYPAVILGTLQLIVVNRKAWYGVLLPLAGTVLYDCGWGSRSHIFDMLLLFFLLSVFLPLPQAALQWKHGARQLAKKAAKPGKILLVLVLAGGIFVMNTIGEKTRETKTRAVGNLSLPLSVVQVIDYNIGTLIGFDSTIDDTSERTWGRMSFFGIEQWLRLLRIVPESIPVPEQLVSWEHQYVRYQPDYHWRRAGNVFTWLRYIYSDFGVPGLFILPFFVGFLASRFIIKALSRSDGLAALLFASLWYIILLRSSTIFMFRNDAFVFAMFLIFCAGRRIVGPVNSCELYGHNISTVPGDTNVCAQ